MLDTSSALPHLHGTEGVVVPPVVGCQVVSVTTGDGVYLFSVVQQYYILVIYYCQFVLVSKSCGKVFLFCSVKEHYRMCPQQHCSACKGRQVSSRALRFKVPLGSMHRGLPSQYGCTWFKSWQGWCKRM